MFKIDDDVPLPRGRGSYPLGELEVGQSFFVPGNTNVASLAVNHRPKKFTTRKKTEGGVTGIRVWRVE
jgi:hypothetical protein